MMPEGCTLRIQRLSSGYGGLPRSSPWAARSPSCLSAGSLTSCASALSPTRKTSRSPCSDISWPCYVAKWHGLGTPRPIAPCWPLSPDRSAVTVGASSSSRGPRCCAGTGTSSPAPGRTLDAAAAPLTPWRTTSSPLSCAWRGRTPRWGYLRIVGECRKLGLTVSATTVRKVLRRHRLGPAPRTTGPSWSEFLRAQAAGTLACDFFHVAALPQFESGDVVERVDVWAGCCTSTGSPLT